VNFLLVNTPLVLNRSSWGELSLNVRSELVTAVLLLRITSVILGFYAVAKCLQMLKMWTDDKYYPEDVVINYISTLSIFGIFSVAVILLAAYRVNVDDFSKSNIIVTLNWLVFFFSMIG